MKKVIAREVLIFLCTSAVFGIIFFVGWILQPKEIEFKINPEEWMANNSIPPPAVLLDSSKAYYAIWQEKNYEEKSKELELKKKEYFDNEIVIDNHWRTVIIIGIILLVIVYPVRGLYYLIKWSLNTIKV